MFAIDFKYYNKNIGMYCNDTFECDKSYNKFKAYLTDNNILNYEIIEIRPYFD